MWLVGFLFIRDFEVFSFYFRDSGKVEVVFVIGFFFYSGLGVEELLSSMIDDTGSFLSIGYNIRSSSSEEMFIEFRVVLYGFSEFFVNIYIWTRTVSELFFYRCVARGGGGWVGGFWF